MLNPLDTCHNKIRYRLSTIMLIHLNLNVLLEREQRS